MISATLTTRVDLEGIIMLSEINQGEKDKYCMISLIREINKPNKWQNMNRTETDSQI